MRVVGGMVGGVVGSVLMAVPIFAARAAGLLRKPPPERITEGLLERAGIRLDRQTEDQLGLSIVDNVPVNHDYSSVKSAVEGICGGGVPMMIAISLPSESSMAAGSSLESSPLM